jgi:hypothetical protein
MLPVSFQVINITGCFSVDKYSIYKDQQIYLHRANNIFFAEKNIVLLRGRAIN